MQPAPRVPNYGPPSEFRAFGIAYIGIRGVLLGLVIVVLLMAASSVSGPSARDSGNPLAAAMGVVILVFAIWMAYVIGASVLAFKGYIAGPIMGAIDGGGSLVLGLVGLLMNMAQNANAAMLGGGGCGILMNGAILTFAWKAIRAQQADRRMGVPGTYQPYGQPIHPAGGAPGHAAYPAPVARPARRPVPGRPAGPNAGLGKVSRPQAVARVIGAAVSADGMSSDARLKRAQQGALKLLGEKNAALVQAELAKPPEFDDLDAYLMPLVQVLRAVPDAALANNLVKVARYVVAENGVVDPMAEEFLNTLRTALGAAG
ncbi:MAG: TerB family tellurite resistance protein [Planctomycetes bacterium]|nr:TerB family tellurite resistance protein [Planctomycetota bacterium]